MTLIKKNWDHTWDLRAQIVHEGQIKGLYEG